MAAANMADYETLLRAALEKGFPIEAALAALREQGASLIESVKVVREVQGLSLTEARQLVVDSQAWKEMEQ